MKSIRRIVRSRWSFVALAWVIIIVLVVEQRLVVNLAFRNMGMLELTQATLEASTMQLDMRPSISAANAIKRLEIASLGGQPQVLFWLGFAHLLNRNVDDAIEHWQNAKPSATKLLTQFSRYAQSMNNGTGKTIDWLDLARKVDPDSPDVNFELGLHAERSMDWLNAVTLFERTAILDSVEPNLMLQAKAYEHASNILSKHLSDYGKAEKYAKLAIAKAPELVNAYVILGNIYFSTGQVELASQQYARAIELEPMQYETRYQMGRTMLMLGQFEQAVTHLEVAAQLYHADPWLSLQLGDAYRETGQYDKARERYGQVIRLAPGDRSAILAEQYLSDMAHDD